MGFLRGDLASLAATVYCHGREPLLIISAYTC